VQHAAACAFAEPPALRARIDASRSLHARIARVVADRFTAAGAELAQPQAAFYLYPDFAQLREHLADRWSVNTSDDLARVLLDECNVATLPGSVFGEEDDTLKLRVATSLLYGDDEQQRLAALEHPRPETLPWIERALDDLGTALAKLTGVRS
jgi:aspartate aminotransferase